MHLAGDYRVSELLVQTEDWLADKPLKTLRLPEEGILVLGIERPDGTFIGTPDGTTELHAGDSAIVYGSTKRLEDLDTRRRGQRGEMQHGQAVSEQRHVRREEKRSDPNRHRRRRQAAP